MRLEKIGIIAIFAMTASLMACPADRRPTEETTPPAEPAAEEPAAEPEAPPAAEPEEPAAAEPETPERAEDEGPIGPPRASARELVPGDGNLYGIFRTNKGVIVVRFLEEEAPVTVANFVGLATGQVRYEHHQTREIQKSHFYDGTIFHRVIPDFMIQGGDPTGTGSGGPGYRFADERQQISFDRPGLLAKANAGPNTNGSQFFITERPTPHLTGRHTIFGAVESGMDVALSIARVERGPMDRPVEPVVLQTVEIVRAPQAPTP